MIRELSGREGELPRSLTLKTLGSCQFTFRKPVSLSLQHVSGGLISQNGPGPMEVITGGLGVQTPPNWDKHELSPSIYHCKHQHII